jgi:Domain of unknown function DUF29
MQLTNRLYEADTAAWAQTSANLLREHRFDELDIEHLIEELEDMGKSERRALESHLVVLLMHLLKWQYQPGLRTTSWKLSIANARQSIDDTLQDSPSLTPRFAEPEFVERAYSKARRLAAIETSLDISVFPEHCQYGTDQLHADWLPS